jgi:uncharacterized protein YdbL (DUF1318 family)
MPTRDQIRRILTTSISVLLLLALSTTTASALEWDQARVTQLAGELQNGLLSLLHDPGLAPEQMTSMQDRKHAAAVANLKALERTTAQLTELLREGRDRGVTEPLFDRMRDLIETVREFAEDSTLGASAAQHAIRVTKSFAKLRLYYS